MKFHSGKDIQPRVDANTAIKAFSNEATDPLSIIFLRELIQNAIDATYKGIARLHFFIVKVTDKNDKKYLDELYKEPRALHKHTRTEMEKGEEYTALVIEEFNTIGLTGTEDPDPADVNILKDSHWSNFMFGNMRETKDGDTGGSRGVGKIVSNMTSALRIVIAKTVRSTDKEVWLGGRIEYEKAPRIGTDNTKYDNWGYLTDHSDPANASDITDVWKPVKDKTHISKISSIYDLKRKDNENGTSWIIPEPLFRVNNKNDITPLHKLEDLEKEAVKEFHWAIIRGDLEVDFGNGLIDQNNIKDFYLKHFPDDIHYWTFIESIFDNPKEFLIKSTWDRNDIKSFLDESSIDEARELLHDNQLIDFKFPIQVKHKDRNTHTSNFHIYVMKNDQLSSTRAMFIRKWLPISGECNLKTHKHPVFLWTFVEEKVLGTFLGDCEEADHKHFSGPLAEKKRYIKAKDTLADIRAASKRLLDILFELNDNEFKNLLGEMFGIAVPVKSTKPKKQTKKRKKGKRKKPTVYAKDHISHKVSSNKVIIETGSQIFDPSELPKKVTLEVSSDRALLGKGTNLWPKNGFDTFDAGFTNSKVISQKGINILIQNKQELVFEIIDPDFILELDKFESRRAGTSQINY